MEYNFCQKLKGLVLGSRSQDVRKFIKEMKDGYSCPNFEQEKIHKCILKVKLKL